METIKKRIRYRNDVFFKYAFANDDENSTFIRNTIIEEITGIKPIESIVLNPNMDSIFIDKKGVILDVHIKDEDGVEYDIEMQTTMIGDTERKRFEFYGARMINNQLDKGENYSLLKQVYQILFVESLPKGNRELINAYQMRTSRGEVEYEKALLHRI